MLILQLYNSSECPAPHFGHFLNEALLPFFQNLAFLRKDCPPNLNEFQQSKLHNAEIITAGAYCQYKTYACAHKYSWNMDPKNDTLFISWKRLGMTGTFFALNLCLSSIFCYSIILMASLAFFPLNMHSGTMYIPHHLSAIATTFFGWRFCNFQLPVFTLL